jgi:hypothetical protein
MSEERAGIQNVRPFTLPPRPVFPGLGKAKGQGMRHAACGVRRAAELPLRDYALAPTKDQRTPKKEV